MVFPEGFTYNRKDDKCRTLGVNEIFYRSAAWGYVLEEEVKTGTILDIVMSPYLWEHTGSNRGPSACKADALNQLSYAPFFLFRMAKIGVFISRQNFFKK